MTELRNNINKNYALIVNNGPAEFVVHFGYFHGTSDAYGNETITNRKVYKTEKTALKKANEYIS